MKKIGFLRFFFLFLCTGSFFCNLSFAISSFEETRQAYRQSDAILLDRHGEMLQSIRMDGNGRRLEWISLKEISPALQSLVIQSEDKRFYRHHGVDWMALSSAFISNLKGSHPRGASTISMQLVSILNPDLRTKSSRKSFTQKKNQILKALEIEKVWSKAQILEAYLNLISFRGELQGISAASRGLFSKEPHGLNKTDSLILAALIPAPNSPAQRVVSRACRLSKVLKEDPENCREIERLADSSLSNPHVAVNQEEIAPHAAQLLLPPPGLKTKVKLVSPPSEGNIRMISTLDKTVQQFAIEALKHQLMILNSQNVHDGAILVVENKTGEVLAYVGNGGSRHSSAHYIDGVRAKRQAGSTLKPFLYEMALEKRLLTTASIIDDSPVDIPVERGVYRPKNFDHQFEGPVTLRVALASSLNIPAVKTIELVGVDPFVQRLRDLGFKDLSETDDFYGPSIALGSVDVSLWELVNAYRTLANGGRWSALSMKRDHDDPGKGKYLLSKEGAYLISDILSSRESRSLTFGLENSLATPFWSVVKTGTSKDMRDNWCIGFTENFTVGVWIGNFPGEPMWDVSGMTGAAPIWSEVMKFIHKDQLSEPKTRPEGVILRKIGQGEGLSETKELFIRGTEPELEQAVIFQERSPKIVYPVSGMEIAIDPDIPGDQQRLFFESEPGDKGLKWVLNGMALENSSPMYSWQPCPGKFVLSLVDRKQQVIDSVNFVVKGAFAGNAQNNGCRA